MHEFEHQVFDHLVKLGGSLQNAVFKSMGSGDVGPELDRRDSSKPLIRFPELSTRSYRSVFGDFEWHDNRLVKEFVVLESIGKSWRRLMHQCANLNLQPRALFDNLPAMPSERLK